MKIAQVVSTYPPYRGGMGNVAHEYVERLRARGHDVHVFTPRTRPVADDPKYVHRIPSPLHFGNAGMMPSLYWRLSGFAVIHLHYPFFGGAEPTIVGKAIRHDQGLVMTYHMDAVAPGIKGMIFEAHRRLLFPWLTGRADRILVSTKEYAQTCALAEVEGALDKVEILPFGVDLEKFRPGSEPELRAALKIPSGVPVLLFVGGLDPAHHFKGLPVLLEALRGIKEKAWHAVIVGEGSLRASFAATAAAEGLGEKMTFAGNVADADLPKYYRLADLLCFPSTERAEAFGLVALEAAASGRPCVASNLPGVRSVVVDGQTGSLVRPKDAAALREAIAGLLEDQGWRERLGLAARARAEADYAWEPQIARLEQIYRAIVENRQRG